MPHPAAHLTDRTQATDASLAARLALGDAAALDPLYRRHKGQVYRFALLWSGSPSTAADVTQDVFPVAAADRTAPRIPQPDKHRGMRFDRYNIA